MEPGCSLQNSQQLDSCPYPNSYQTISPIQRPSEVFRKTVRFYCKELLSPRPTPELEDHPLSAVRHCLFNILAAILHIWRPFLHPQPEDAPCRGDRDPLITVTGTHLSRSVPKHSLLPNYDTTWTGRCTALCSVITETPASPIATCTVKKQETAGCHISSCITNRKIKTSIFAACKDSNSNMKFPSYNLKCR
jgi:hypothetical protein